MTLQDLSQIPLLLSIKAPTAVTLPFKYANIPSSAPQFAHGSEVEQIVENQKALRQQINANVEHELTRYDDWRKQKDEEELLQKKKLAPGYLDSSNKILQPMKASNGSSRESTDVRDPDGPDESEINEIDRAFDKL